MGHLEEVEPDGGGALEDPGEGGQQEARQVRRTRRLGLLHAGWGGNLMIVKDQLQFRESFKWGSFHTKKRAKNGHFFCKKKRAKWSLSGKEMGA